MPSVFLSAASKHFNLFISQMKRLDILKGFSVCRPKT